MKKRIYKTISILLLLVMMVQLTGCKVVFNIKQVEVETMVDPADIEKETGIGSGVGSAGAKRVEEEKMSGELKIQVFTNESGRHSEAWTNVVTAFEKATGIKVTLLMGSQVNTQYSASWLSGETPADIIWIAGNGIADDEMEASGMFYDLKDTLTNGNIYGTTAKISDKINMDVIKVLDDHMYRAPLMTSVQGMWYNKNLIPDAPKNIDEFTELSKKLKEKNIAGMTYPGIYADYSIWAFIMPAVAAYGDDFFVEVAKGTPEAFQDKRFKEVLTRYKKYCDKGYMMKGSTSADHTSSQLDWLNGKAGLITNGLWLEAEMQDFIPKDFKMTFCASPLITAEQKPTIIQHSNNIAVAAKSQNIENALAFVRYIYRDDVQIEFMSKYSYLSALKDLNYENAELTEVARNTLDYVNSDEVNVIPCNVSWSGLVNNTFKKILNDITSGKMSVDEACRQLTRDAKR